MELNLTKKTSYSPLDMNFIYTYNEFITNIENIELYVDYILKLINTSDYVFFQYDTKYARKVESECNAKLINTININGHFYIKDRYLIDLNKNKEKFIELFKMNLSDPDEREPYDYNIKNKHIVYDEFLDNVLVIIKNNKLLYNIILSDGFVYDYNDFKLLNEYKKELNLNNIDTI